MFVPGGTVDTSIDDVTTGNNETDAQAEYNVGNGTLTANTTTTTTGQFNLTVTDGNGNTDFTTFSGDSNTDVNTREVSLTNISGSVDSGDTLTVTLIQPNDVEADTDTVSVVDLVSGASDLQGNEFAVRDDGTLQSSAVLDSESQFQILLNPDAGAFNAGGSAFGEGEQATLDIVSPAGAATQVELRAPDLFNTKDEAVRL
nr:hypothetical protein [Halorubrum salsamenti]